MKKHLKHSLALCALLVPGLAMAANFVPATGDYSIDANWDTGLVPGAGETAAVYGGTVTVTTTENVGSILMSAAGSYTIAAGGDLTASAQALIGNPGAGSLLGGSLSGIPCSIAFLNSVLLAEAIFWCCFSCLGNF